MPLCLRYKLFATGNRQIPIVHRAGRERVARCVSRADAVETEVADEDACAMLMLVRD